MRFSTRKSNTPSEYMYRLRFYFPTELHLLQFLIAAISFRLIRIAWRSVLRHRVNFCAGIRHGKKFFPGLGIFLRAFPYARYFSCLLTVYVVLVLLKESRLDNFEFVFVLFMCVCVWWLLVWTGVLQNIVERKEFTLNETHTTQHNQ